MSSTIQNQPSLTSHALAGALTTFVSVPIVHPVYTICTLLVTKANIKRSIMPNNKLSLKVLYRGTLANGLCDLSGQVTVFSSYGCFHRLYSEEIAGVGAAFAASPVYNFWDRIMIVQQATGKTMRQAVRSIQAKEGTRGLLKGTSWTFLQESLYQPFFFSLSNKIGERLNKKKVLPLTFVNGICYLSSGLVIGAVTTPLQYIRTLVYNDLGKRSARALLKELTWENKTTAVKQFACIRVPLIGVNMLVAGLAKDFFLASYN